jgi:ABC-type transport system substrate-binding protein
VNTTGAAKKSLVALLGIGALLITACSGTNSATGGTSSLTIAEQTPPDTLDSQATPLTKGRYAWEMSYECLLNVGEDGKPEPRLAKSFEASADGLTYTFDLRDDVSFHNGEHFVADDVVYTYDRLLKTGVPYVKDRVRTLESVKAAGEYKVVFTLKAPDPGFSLNMGDPTVAGCAILNRKAGESENLAIKMVGTGPFEQVSYTKDTQLTFKRFEKYWGKKANPGEVQVLYLPDESARRAAITSGKADLTFVDSTGRDALKGKSNITVTGVQTNNASHIQLNNARAPFDNLDVRRAVSLALDRGEMSDSAYQKAAVPSYGIPSSYTWAPKPGDLSYVGPDVAQAKQLLAKAGYPSGFSTSLVYIANYSPGTDRLAQVFQGELKKIGIDLKLEPLEQAAWLDRSGGATHDYDLSWNQYGFFADPYQYVAARTGRQGPAPAPVQKTIDDLLKASPSGYIDAIKQFALASNTYVWPTIPVASLETYVAYSSRLQNVVVPPSESRVFLQDIT